MTTRRRRHTLTSLALVVIVAFASREPRVIAAAQGPALKIVVLEGEGAVNIIQQKTAVAPVIEVRDRNNQPVSGAVVRFAIKKGKASFGGSRTLTISTDAFGRATATGLTPTGSGALQIAASAAFQGQAVAVTIAQTTVMTAAEASAAAGASAGVAGGSGGLSHLAIAGIVGGAGAAAGAAVIASKASSSSQGSTQGPNSSPADQCRASAICGVWNVFFSPPLATTPCGGTSGDIFGSQAIAADLNGTFHGTWAPPTPLIMADGTFTQAGVNGTLRCVSTAATGTMSATPSGSDYVGTATLGGSSVSIRLVKQS